MSLLIVEKFLCSAQSHFNADCGFRSKPRHLRLPQLTVT